MDQHFEWDPDKAERNLRKHGVGFEEASSVFGDPLYITLLDEAHSSDEERYVTIGRSRRGNLLLIAHTERRNNIRIISARKATNSERRFYEEAE